jgi:4-amino-4-deoxy-L-arabinose transferase-like glycosyltransferase
MLFIPFAATQGRASLTSATGTFIQNGHMGPIYLSDFMQPDRWGQMGGVGWPSWVWQILTLLAILNSGLLVCWLTAGYFPAGSRGDGTGHRQNRLPYAQRRLNSAIVFGLAAAACPILVVILSISTGVLDRYWMTLFPLLFAIVPEAFHRA